MYRIDELITDIHTDEVVEIPGELTDEQQERIAKEVCLRIEQSVDRRFPKRRRGVLLLVAALILALGLTAFAARKNEWDITLINFMGLNKSDVLQLEGGEVIINEIVTSQCVDYANDQRGQEKQISITGITSIGDRNSAYLRVDTDYQLPKDFDETTDYILPENSSVKITYKNIFGHIEFRSFASIYTAFYEDGKLGFLISIENCEDINKCDVSLMIENLYLYHDLGKYEETDESEPEELLCEGLWETSWTYSYKSNVKTQRMFKKIDTGDGDYFLTKVEISPISIRIEAIRNPKDRAKEWNGEILEEICYKDGSSIRIGEMSSAGMSNGIFMDVYVNAEEIGETLRPDEVEILKICGQNVDIKVR